MNRVNSLREFERTDMPLVYVMSYAIINDIAQLLRIYGRIVQLGFG